MRSPASVVALALALGGSLSPVRAAPLPAEVTVRALDALARDPRRADALPRLLALVPSLDALAPDAASAALERLAASPEPLLAARARFAHMAFEAAPDPAALGLVGADAGFWVGGDVDGDPDPTSRARALLDRGSAALGAPVDPEDLERGWEPAVVSPRGALALDVAATPDTDGVVHALGRICLDGRPVVLRLGVAGDTALAIDGAIVGAASGLARAELDQLEVPLALAAGPHTVLVTVRPGGEPAALRLRVTDPRGRPVDVRCASPDAELAWSRGADADAALGPPAALRRAPAPWPLVAERALGFPDGGLEDALLAAPDSFDELTYVLAADLLPRPEARMSALAARPDSALASAVLAALALERGQAVRARELVARLPETDLTRWLARRIARLEPRVPPAYADLASAPPDPSERGRLEAARLAATEGRADHAAAALAALVAAIPSPERLDLRASLARAWVAAGAPERAVEVARATAEARPDRIALALDAIDKMLSLSPDPVHPVEADARARLASLSPRLRLRPDHLVLAGRLWERLGEPSRAAELYARALVLRPADEDARARLEALQGDEPVPLTIAATAELAAEPPLDADAPWEVMAEEEVVRVAADGSATRWLRRVMRAQHPPRERDDRTFRWRFDPGRESVRVLGARVLAPDGATRAVSTREIRTASEDWFGLYYDVRILTVPFDDLAPGSLVEVTLRTDAVGQLFPGVYESLEVLQDRVPKHRHRLVVEAPVALGLRSRVLRPTATATAPPAATFPIEEARVALPDGRERLTLEARALPALPLEPSAPGAAEASPSWQVTTFGSWAEVARFYARLLASQARLTPDMRARVAATVAEARGAPDAVARALVALVQRDIRYVGLEFGIHGYKPYATSDVWSRRFGDCKDQALLLRTLLGEGGVAADVVLVRTRQLGRLPDPLPSLAIFDHAIVRLRDRDELVDSTVVRQGMDDLPGPDQGAQALVIDDATTDLVTTPVDPPTRNQIVGAYAVAIGPSGQGSIQGTVALHGSQAPYYRELLADEATRADALQALLNRRYPGLALTSARTSDPERLDRPIELVFEATVPRLAAPIGATLQVARPAGIDGQAERVAPTPTRAQPVVLGPPMTFDLTFRYMPPSGWRPSILPASAAAAGPFGRWSVRWTELGGVITVRTELAWAVDQVPAEQYDDLRSFVRAFDAAVGPTLVLEPSGAAPMPTSGATEVTP